jgi:transcriptional regulator with XRE-family HTH domain
VRSVESAPFGRLLRQLRTERGLTLRGLAAATEGELSAQAICRLELGQRAPLASTLVVLARALGVRFVANGGGIELG